MLFVIGLTLTKRLAGIKRKFWFCFDHEKKLWKKQVGRIPV